MKYYRVLDNSYCINVKTHNYANLVQMHDRWYSPNKNEDGAEFEIVSGPYKQYIEYYGMKEFVDVKSTFTGNIYRVLYNKHCIYES